MASAIPRETTSRPNMNKKARARFGKDTINITIPNVLKANERARAGVSASRLVSYDPSFSPKKLPAQKPSQAPKELPTRISVAKSDTLDAAHSLLMSNPGKRSRIAVLNMASPLRPGGGVLSGARAQEESLCLRSTLYPSLRDAFYRLPEDSAVHSPDVLVFRSSDHADLPKDEWFFVDVVSCAALRFPEVVVAVAAEMQAEGDDDGRRAALAPRKAYASDAAREAMTRKVRTVMQVAVQSGATHLVLGALGCGAYGNPPGEVARIFKKVLCGDKKRPGMTVEGSGIEEVVFAIFDEGENLSTFREVFADVEC